MMQDVTAYVPPPQPESAPEDIARLSGMLQSRNVRIHGRRTSVRLEREMWSALHEVAGLENCTIHDLCGAVHDMKEDSTSFTAALRVFLMEYYRNVSRGSLQVAQVQQRLRSRNNTASSSTTDKGD